MVHRGSTVTAQGADGMLNEASLSPAFSPRSPPVEADGSELETSTGTNVAVYPTPSPTRTSAKTPLRRSLVIALDRERREAHEKSRGRVLPDELIEAAAAHVFFSDDATGPGGLQYASPQARSLPLPLKALSDRSRSLDESPPPSDAQLDFKTLPRSELSRPEGSPIRPASAIITSTGTKGSDEECSVIPETLPASSSSDICLILQVPETVTGISTSFAALGIHDESPSCEDNKGTLMETSAFRHFPLLSRQKLHARSQSDPSGSPSLRHLASMPTFAAASILPPRPRHASTQRALSSVATGPDELSETDLSPLEFDVPSPPKLISSYRQTPPQSTMHWSQSIPLLPTLSTAEAEVKALSLPPSPSSDHVKRLIS